MPTPRPFLKRAVLVAGVAAATLSLAACGGLNVREELGLITEGPDEFRVVRNDDLQVPSDLPSSVDELPEPQPGAPSRVAPRPIEDAAAALGGFDTGGAAGTGSAAEDALLAGAGAASADPSVREDLAAEAAEAEADIRILDSILGTSRGADEALDAAAEAERLARDAGLQ